MRSRTTQGERARACRGSSRGRPHGDSPNGAAGTTSVRSVRALLASQWDAEVQYAGTEENEPAGNSVPSVRGVAAATIVRPAAMVAPTPSHGLVTVGLVTVGLVT